MHHYYYDHGFWGMHFFWWIFWLLIILGIILLFSKRIKAGRSESNKAMDILRERFARGEISEQEFMERKNILDKD